MFAFEESKLQKIGLLGEHIRVQYRKKYAIRFSESLPMSGVSIGNGAANGSGSAKKV